MPVYDYLCETCGPFTDMAPMAAFATPLACPDCGASAPRAILAAPMFNGMNGSARTAHATNEKNAHAPDTTARTGRHPPGCGCCKISPKSKPDALKGFAGTRPWMISH